MGYNPLLSSFCSNVSTFSKWDFFKGNCVFFVTFFHACFEYYLFSCTSHEGSSCPFLAAVREAFSREWSGYAHCHRDIMAALSVYRARKFIYMSY